MPSNLFLKNIILLSILGATRNCPSLKYRYLTKTNDRNRQVYIGLRNKYPWKTLTTACWLLIDILQISHGHVVVAKYLYINKSQAGLKSWSCGRYRIFIHKQISSPFSLFHFSNMGYCDKRWPWHEGPCIIVVYIIMPSRPPHMRIC